MDASSLVIKERVGIHRSLSDYRITLILTWTTNSVKAAANECSFALPEVLFGRELKTVAFLTKPLRASRIPAHYSRKKTDRTQLPEIQQRR